MKTICNFNWKALYIFYFQTATIFTYGQHQKLFFKTTHLEEERTKALGHHILHAATKGKLAANFTQNTEVDKTF